MADGVASVPRVTRMVTVALLIVSPAASRAAKSMP